MNRKESYEEHQLALLYRVFKVNMDIAKSSNQPLTRWAVSGARECYKSFLELSENKYTWLEERIGDMESNLEIFGRVLEVQK